MARGVWGHQLSEKWGSLGQQKQSPLLTLVNSENDVSLTAKQHPSHSKYWQCYLLQRFQGIYCLFLSKSVLHTLAHRENIYICVLMYCKLLFVILATENRTSLRERMVKIRYSNIMVLYAISENKKVGLYIQIKGDMHQILQNELTGQMIICTVWSKLS